MIIQDRETIEQKINAIANADNDRVINIDAKDFEPILACDTLAAIEVEAEDMANLAVTARREILETGVDDTKNVVLSIACSRSYGLTMVDMEKISCVVRAFKEGTELLWGVSYDNTMPMNKVRVTVIIGK